MGKGRRVRAAPRALKGEGMGIRSESTSIARALCALCASLVATVGLVASSPLVAGASASKAKAVRAWTRAHIKTLDRFGNDLESVDVTPIANVAQCRMLSTETKKVMRLPAVPDPSIESYWKKGTTDIFRGSQACVHARTATQTSNAYSTMEIGAEDLQIAARAIDTDGGGLNFGGGAPSLKAPSTTTVTTA